MGEGVNRLARVLDGRMKSHNDVPPILDFGTIMDDMSLVTNKFPRSIPYTDYVICRSVCYDPTVPLTMTRWNDEGWNSQSEPVNWEDQHWTRNGQPAERRNRWGELINPSGNTNWDMKHRSPPISGPSHIHNSKGEHDHEEDPDGKHYHNVNLPRKMYRIQPGDRVLVAWVGDDACVIDIVMAATEMM